MRHIVFGLAMLCACAPGIRPVPRDASPARPEIHALLVHYGSYLDSAALSAYIPVIEDRFRLATEGAVALVVDGVAVLPLKDRRYISAKKKYPWLSEASERRIWFYDHKSDWGIAYEIWGLLKRSPYRVQAKHADIILVLSEAQFEEIGSLRGRIALVEQPMEVAWALKDTARTEINSPWYIADVLTHEIGHFMGLGHPRTDKNAACPDRHDIMSSCRERNRVDETRYDIFSACALRHIREAVVPVLLSGGAAKFSRTKCD